MQMRQRVFLKSKFDFAILRQTGEDEVWQVSDYYEFLLDALAYALGVCRNKKEKIVLAERGAIPMLIMEGKIVNYYWFEWEVVWKS